MHGNRYLDLGQPVNWQSPLNQGLASWWRPMPVGPYGSGARLLDLCGKSHGTLVNGPTWTSAPHGSGGLIFDGSNDQIDFSKYPGGERYPLATLGLADVAVALWWTPFAWPQTDPHSGFPIHASGVGGGEHYPYTDGQCYLGTLRGVFRMDFITSTQPNTSRRRVMVYHSPNENIWQLYENGVLAHSATAGSYQDLGSTFAMGYSGTTSYRAYGILEDVKFWVAKKLPPNPSFAQLDYEESARGCPTTLNWRRRRVYFDMGGGINADAPVGMFSLAGIAPISSKAATSPVGSLELSPVAPTTSKAAGQSPGAIEFATVVPSTSKAFTATAESLTFAGVAPTSSLSPLAPVGMVSLAGVAPASSKAAAGTIGAISFAGLAGQTGTPAYSPVGEIAFTSVALATSKGAAASPGAIELAGVSPSSSKAVALGYGAMEFAGVAPLSGSSVLIAAGAFALAGSTPATSKGVLADVGSVAFAAGDVTTDGGLVLLPEIYTQLIGIHGNIAALLSAESNSTAMRGSP